MTCMSRRDPELRMNTTNTWEFWKYTDAQGYNLTDFNLIDLGRSWVSVFETMSAQMILLCSLCWELLFAIIISASIYHIMKLSTQLPKGKGNEKYRRKCVD